MSDTVRLPFDHVYTDLQENEVYNQEKGIRLQDAMIAPKFKYEYSFTEGLLFQITVTVLDKHSEEWLEYHV